jgi:hypothetical protein
MLPHPFIRRVVDWAGYIATTLMLDSCSECYNYLLGYDSLLMSKTTFDVHRQPNLLAISLTWQ